MRTSPRTDRRRKQYHWLSKPRQELRWRSSGTMPTTNRNAVFDLFYLHAVTASVSAQIAHARLDCGPIFGCSNFGSSLVTSPSDIYKAEANSAALSASYFRSNETSNNDIALYYRKINWRGHRAKDAELQKNYRGCHHHISIEA